MRGWIPLFVLLVAPVSVRAATTIPYELIDNRMVIRCELNGVPGFAMILDTGASGVLITPQVARRLALRTKPYGYVSGAGSGRTLFERAQVRNVRLGGLQLATPTVFVAGLDQIRRGIGFARLDGVVGFDELGSRYVAVNVDRRTLTISDVPVPHPAGAQSFKLAVRDGLLTVPVQVDGIAGNAILDTGDRSSLTLFKRFANQFGFYSIEPSVRNVQTGFGVGGPVRSDVFRTKLTVFHFTVPAVVTRASRDAGGVFATSAEAGSIGNGFLQRFNAIYDRRRESIVVWPSAAFSKVERYDPAGMWISAGSGGPIVTSIVAGGPADTAGLKLSDTILSVAGTSMRTWLPPQLRQWFAAQPDGERVGLSVRTVSGTTETANLTLHDPTTAGALDLPRHAVFGAALADKPAGATVVRVIPQSPAAAAGVQPGDVIKSIAGVSIQNTAGFLSAMHALHSGQVVTVLVIRNGSPAPISVRLGAPPDESDPDVTTLYGAIDVDGSLRRTLITFPRGEDARRPAVLVIGGIGCYSIDAASNPQDAYMRLTHDLSRAGFVTMRLEKSGVGDSQGPPCPTVDFEHEEQSYLLALAALRNDPRIDPSRIYLFGHSIGTIVAPRLAESQRVAGIVVAEAVGRDWPEYEIRNVRRQLELGAASPAAVDAAVLEKERCMNRLLFDGEPEASIERDDPGCKVPNGVYPVDAQYMRQVAGLNVIEPWTKLDLPVLVIYGRSDFVTEEADHRRIVDVVNTNHPGRASLIEIDGMDHLLFRAPTPKAAMDAFSGGAPRKYDTALSEAIVHWLTQTKTPGIIHPRGFDGCTMVFRACLASVEKPY